MRPFGRLRRPNPFFVFTVVAGVLGSSLLGPGEVRARAPAATTAPGLVDTRVLSYPYEQVWPTTIRFLRVDRGYELVERDPEAGFLLFSFPTGGESPGTGSIELLRVEDDAGRAAVRLAVRTNAGPAYLPHNISTGIADKVRAERGAPAPPRQEDPDTPPTPDPPPEGDTDDDLTSKDFVPPIEPF